MDFDQEMFDRYPVWKWNDSMDGHVPLEIYEPLPEDECDLFISALFETPKGQIFRGYLVGDETFYAFGVFVDKKEFALNFRLKPLLLEALEKIRREVDDSSFELFPLKYEIAIDPGEGVQRRGVFQMP